MSRFTITVEDDLIDEAMVELGTRTKAETVRAALAEVLRRRRLAEALARQGSVELDLDRNELERLRAER